MRKKNRLSDIEDTGFYFALVFASLVVGMFVLAAIGKLVSIFF
jgi:hypothetical protein